MDGMGWCYRKGLRSMDQRDLDFSCMTDLEPCHCSYSSHCVFIILWPGLMDMSGAVHIICTALLEILTGNALRGAFRLVCTHPHLPLFQTLDNTISHIHLGAQHPPHDWYQYHTAPLIWFLKTASICAKGALPSHVTPPIPSSRYSLVARVRYTLLGQHAYQKEIHTTYYVASISPRLWSHCLLCKHHVVSIGP